MSKSLEYEPLTEVELIMYRRLFNRANRDRDKEREYERSRSKIINEQRRKRRAENPEPFRKYHQGYRQSHLEKVRKYDREWKRRRRTTHPDKMRQIEKNNYSRNPGRYINKNRKRRALKRGREAVDCSSKIDLLNRERFCHWCCIRVTDENRSIDHVIPLARGGHHIPDNLVACCRKCNSSKQDKLVEEWTWEMAA